MARKFCNIEYLNQLRSLAGPNRSKSFPIGYFAVTFLSGVLVGFLIFKWRYRQIPQVIRLSRSMTGKRNNPETMPPVQFAAEVEQLENNHHVQAENTIEEKRGESEG